MTFPPYTRAGLVLVCCGLLACSGGDSGGPRLGTPEWYWAAAQETFEAADYVKTQEHLEHVVNSDLDVKQQAAVWRTLVLAGLARGYMELGDAYAETVEKNPRMTAQFQIPIQEYRRVARRHAIELTESMSTLRKLIAGSEQVSFDFAFPAGSPNVSPVLTQLKAGQNPPPNQLLDAEKETLKRGILLEASEMVGAGEDVNRARTLFDTRPVSVASADFLWALGDSTYSLSDLFEQKRLNEPQVRKVMLQTALDCIGPALEAQDKKRKEQAEKLKKEIEQQQGKLKA